MPEIFEHERFSTTMANAVCAPVVVDYVSRLGEKLAAAGYKRDLLLLHSGGGVMTPASVKDFSARLAGSGIAAGAIASRFHRKSLWLPELDRLRHGRHQHRRLAGMERESRITKDWYIEFGYPIRFPPLKC